MLGFLYSVGQVKKKQPRSLRSPFSISFSLYREFFPRLSYRTYILISLFRVLIPSLSLLLPLSRSFSLARYAPLPFQPATHNPPSLPQPPRPSPRHSTTPPSRGRRPTSSSTSAAAAASTLSLPPPLVPKPKETRDRFEFKLLNTRLPRVKSDTSARRWYDAISFSTRYWKYRRWCKNSPTFTYRSWLSFPKNSLIERDDGTWYEKSMTLFCPKFQDR